MNRFLILFIIVFGLYSCTTEETVTSSTTSPSPSPIVIDPDPGWRGKVVTRGYIHSLVKQLTKYASNRKDSSYQDSNLKDTTYNNLASTLKIGMTFDSLSNGTRIYWNPQNGFVLFDLQKYFGGKITNIKTANLKVKLFKRWDYTDDMKFTVVILDSTILAKSIKERLETIQSATGVTTGYLSECTIDLKDKFTPSKKIVIGIKAENPKQAFASVEYFKIEFDGDITPSTSNSR